MNAFKKMIQDYVLRLKMNRIYNSTAFIPFDDIRNAIVFCDASLSSEKELINLHNLLYSKKINCKLLMYVPYISIEDSNMNITYVRDKDISWKGSFIDNTVNEIYENDYDVLFDLRNSSTVLSDFLVKSLKYKFSVGIADGVKGADVVIETKGDIKKFIELIIEYLKKLKS